MRPNRGLLVTRKCGRKLRIKLSERRALFPQNYWHQAAEGQRGQADAEQNCLCSNFGFLRSIQTRTAYVSARVNQIVVYVQES